MWPAMLYRKLEENAVQCLLCNHYCRLSGGQRGICGVRENREGELFSLVYGRLAALQADPVEKKPLFHFLPGTMTLSLATVGCNFSCRFCQNHHLVQLDRKQDPPGQFVPPEEIVSQAIRNGCKSISYTYSEPTVFFELCHATGELAKKSGLRNIFVTNGFMSREALEPLTGFLDAANVDLKSFSDDFYRRICGGRLAPVLDNIRLLKEKGVWVEVTTLLIPGLNDSTEELEELAGFIFSVDSRLPWHVSAFHPDYRMMDASPTSRADVERAIQAGRRAGLKFVYGGNIWRHPAESTYCPDCGRILIEREGYRLRQQLLERENCPFCGAGIPVILA